MERLVGVREQRYLSDKQNSGSGKQYSHYWLYLYVRGWFNLDCLSSVTSWFWGMYTSSNRKVQPAKHVSDLGRSKQCSECTPVVTIFRCTFDKYSTCGSLACPDRWMRAFVHRTFPQWISTANESVAHRQSPRYAHDRVSETCRWLSAIFQLFSSQCEIDCQRYSSWGMSSQCSHPWCVWQGTNLCHADTCGANPVSTCGTWLSQSLCWRPWHLPCLRWTMLAIASAREYRPQILVSIFARLPTRQYFTHTACQRKSAIPDWRGILFFENQ